MDIFQIIEDLKIKYPEEVDKLKQLETFAEYVKIDILAGNFDLNNHTVASEFYKNKLNISDNECSNI